MRLTGVLALLLTISAVPAAHASSSEIVISADRAVTTTITLPRAVTIRSIEVTGRAHYLGVAIADASGEPSFAWLDLTAADRRGGVRWHSEHQNDPVPAGRTTVSVLVDGPVTIRLGVPELGRRMTVRPATPMRGGMFAVRHWKATPPFARDRIPFATVGRAIVVQQYDMPDHQPPTAETMCAAPSSEPVCDIPRVQDDSFTSGGRFYLDWDYVGDAYAEVSFTHLDREYAVTDWLMALPLEQPA